MHTTPYTEHKLSVTLFQLHHYFPRLLASAITKRHGIDYFCLYKVPEPVGSWNFERQKRDLAFGDSVDLRKSSSLFEVLDDYFLASLFHMDVVVFREPTVSFLLHGALVCHHIFSFPTCTTHVFVGSDRTVLWKNFRKYWHMCSQCVPGSPFPPRKRVWVRG